MSINRSSIGSQVEHFFAIPILSCTRVSVGSGGGTFNYYRTSVPWLGVHRPTLLQLSLSITADRVGAGPVHAVVTIGAAGERTCQLRSIRQNYSTSLTNNHGSYQANCQKVHWRKSSQEAIGHQGCKEVCSIHRRSQEAPQIQARNCGSQRNQKIPEVH